MKLKHIVETAGQDVRYSLRLLKKNVGTTLVSILTLALGIGATTSIFSLIYGVLLRPLPYPEPDRIVILERAMKKGLIDPDTTGAKYLFWKEHQHTLAGVAASLGRWEVTLESKGRLQQVLQHPVTAGFFRVLQVQPAIGRTFLPDDEKPGAASVAVLNHDLWQSSFGGSPDILGQSVKLNGQDYVVVGVAGPGVESTLSGDLWTSFDASTEPLAVGDNLSVLARLADNATLAQAQADLRMVAEQLRAASPETVTQDETAAVQLYQDEIAKKARPGLLIFMGAVSLVLLISCANVANVVMARLAARRHELTVRAALGGDRGRVVRQLLTESFCLSLLGGVSGVAVAKLVVWAMVRFRPVRLPRLEEVSLDGRVLLFTLGLSVLVTVLFGLLPALRFCRPELHNSLQDGGNRGSTGPGRERMSRAVVVLELALSVILLVGALLLLRSFVNLWQVDPGFKLDGVITFQASPQGERYATTAQVDGFAQRITERLERIGGVDTAAACACLPLVGSLRLPLHSVDGHPKPPDHYLDTIRWMPITPEFFKVLDIPLRSGRQFQASDSATSLPVAIVNETFAGKHFPEGGAVGRRILIGWDMLGPEYEEGWREIVGVVGDIHEAKLQVAPKPSIFVPLAQVTDHGLERTHKVPFAFLMRMKGEAAPGFEEVQAIVQEVDPSMPVEWLSSMRQVAGDSLKEQSFQATLLGAFALTALVLVTIGVFGVISHSVARRTQEIGIRMAMGASRTNVILWILANGLRMTAVGIAIGLPGAFALSRLLESFLFGVEPHDAAVFVITPALVCLVTLAASYFPARLAARTDAMVALRHH